MDRHYEESTLISASPETLFAYIDDHTRFSSHMNESSWMMGGGTMHVSVDAGRGQEVGSHIRMTGTAFGIRLFLDEVVTRRDPPFVKTWETVDIPKLLVIGSYRMSIEITPKDSGSLLRVRIDYDLPTTNVWLGRLFGGMYARWCVRRMIKDARTYFDTKSLRA
ncbi:SRPBCC family protein [Candidatus Kaiserbacteria bacterium]|nr:SRPBCC family protein [Candidatus Kaiserbacteria bacterium]